MKKLLTLLICLLLMFGCFASSVSAAKTPAFVVGTAKGEAGDTVKITVSTKNNSGIISMKLLIGYDSKALKIVDVKEGKFKSTAYSPENSNPFIVNWIDSIHPDNKTNGTVATITFKILDTATEGKSEISLTYDPEDVFDLDFNNVTFDVQNGYVDITNKKSDSKPAESSNEVSDDETASADVDDTASHEHVHDNSNDETQSDGSDDTVTDTTTSAILEQIYDSANQDGVSDSATAGAATKDDAEKQNDWIVWVVIAAVVLLGGAFAVVIIKGKKEKEK